MKLITLVPAYKTKYIPELLHGLRHQTARTGTVVFSDDSPDGAFRRALFDDAIAPLREGLDIEFHEGPRRGAYENLKHLLRVADGRADLLHILLDDDVIYPEFHERHLQAHASGDFSWSVSRRWTADERGQPLRGPLLPPAVRQHGTRMVALDDQMLITTAVSPCINWLGEFSNAVLRADCADLLLEPRIGDVSFAGLWDIGGFVAGALRRPVCFIQDYLGYFRTSPIQNSANLQGPLMKGAHLGHCAIALGCQRLGRMSDELARANFRKMARDMINAGYAAQPDMAPFLETVPRMAEGVPGAEAQFLDAWATWLAANGM
jgi:hypothetical protein